MPRPKKYKTGLTRQSFSCDTTLWNSVASEMKKRGLKNMSRVVQDALRTWIDEKQAWLSTVPAKAIGFDPATAKHVHVVLPPSAHAWVMSLAHKTNRSVPDVLREALALLMKTLAKRDMA